jgi:hypothetical protein
MTNFTRRSLLAALVVLGFSPPTAFASDDKHAIAHLMKGMFDTPEHPLTVDPVVVLGDNAIAGWVQGDKGGRALLWRVDGQWQIRLCSGDGLKDPKLLENAKISTADAAALVAELTDAEATLDPAVLAKFSSFQGTMMISPDAGHQAHTHGSTTSE